MKITKKGIGARSLIRNIYKVRGAWWGFEMKIKTSDKQVNYSYKSTQTKQQVG